MISDKRREALLKVAERHGIGPYDNNTGAEDLAQFLDHPESILRWVAVTSSTETGICCLNTYSSEEEAKEEEAANIEDPLWAETPVEVVDLDTGTRRIPVVETVWPGDQFVKGMTEVCAEEDAALALEQIAKMGAFPEYPEGEVPPEDLQARLEDVTAIARAKRPNEDGGMGKG